MKRDFHAYFALALQDSIGQSFAIQWLVGERTELPARWPAIAALSTPRARLEVLAQAMATGQQEYARSGLRQQIGGYAHWVRHAAARFLDRQLQDMRTLGLHPISLDLRFFPALSFAIRLPFRLQTPYLSKDDRLFHILDNPVRKEWLFHVPMVAASSWKGALRATLWQLGYKEDHEVTIRLLGNPRESEEQQAGRLHFFPTSFDRIALEVINPHDRESGVGARGPILMECAPQGATGELMMLYVPFGANDQSESDRRAQVAQDLEVLARGIHAMLTTYGFGAKTSNGFGVAKEQLAGEGRLSIRTDLPNGDAPASDVPPERQQPQLPRYLQAPDRLHPDLRRPDGSLKSEEEYRAFIESRGGQYGKKDKQLYDKAKAWWEREGRVLAEARSQEPEAEAEPQLPEPPPVTEYPFNALSELPDLAKGVAEELRKGG